MIPRLGVCLSACLHVSTGLYLRTGFCLMHDGLTSGTPLPAPVSGSTGGVLCGCELGETRKESSAIHIARFCGFEECLPTSHRGRPHWRPPRDTWDQVQEVTSYSSEGTWDQAQEVTSYPSAVNRIADTHLRKYYINYVAT